MERFYVKRMLEKLSPSTLCEHSLKDYHVQGVQYLCLERSHQITTKVYLLDPQLHGARSSCSSQIHSPLDSNDSTPKLDDGHVANPHNHRYHFKTTVLAGQMVNKVFEERPWIETCRNKKDHAHLFWKFAYFYQNHEFVKMNQVVLEPTQWEHVHLGESYELSPEQIHTIQVSDQEFTVLFLQQFQDVVSNEFPGAFYCRESEPPNVQGLYSRYSEMEVDELRRKILELI
ncbi:hypothetical protein C9374_011265 [Naegleria lovaniensis]|uniref:Uncharacterized protein n=1 Tax=Naegleria lovaniensis TaxID=51637 RepID=A0AA88GX20_NAELO|nr:uncharacterized protein C9374_011265 [Naegleria lovaniensis]KAG2392540.1 hypothetical protein C9374_011265 [Naegleria lovaniensis]